MKNILIQTAIIVLVGAGFACPFTGFARPATAQSSLTLSGLPAYNWLRYGKNNVRSSGDFDMGFGLTFRTQLTRNLHLATGINYRQYGGFIGFGGMRDSAHFTDPAEGHRYFLHQIFNNTETQSVTYIEPNVRLEYVLPLTQAVDFVAGVGLGLGIRVAETNRMAGGNFQRYAYFYDIHVLIENFPAMNLGTYTDFINPLQGNTFRTSLFALGQVGFLFRVWEDWQILTMLNFQHSLLNIQATQDVFTHHNSYSGIARSNIPRGVHAFSAGLEIGVVWRFGTRQ